MRTEFGDELQCAALFLGDSVRQQNGGGTMRPNSVKAAVMTGPGRIEPQDFPYPEIGEDAMVIAVEMCGICGTDKHTYRGETTQYGGTTAEQSTPFPIIPGHEIVGKVAEIGRRARTGLEYTGKELNVGDRVVMCPDILCGRCWYCRNAFGFRSARTSAATATTSPRPRRRI